MMIDYTKVPDGDLEIAATLAKQEHEAALKEATTLQQRIRHAQLTLAGIAYEQARRADNRADDSKTDGGS